MNADDNALLTLVENDAAMGVALRQYWHPVLRASRLVSDGAPVRVRLLGKRLLAFRDSGGVAGVLNEACAHRCASLALARNEGHGLRCIFHGWKFDVQGRLIEVPTIAPENQAAFIRTVRTNRYAVREAAGIIWACLLPPESAPPFPEFEFMHLDPAHVDFRIGIMRCNWVQGMESVLDSAHLGFLHRGQLLRSFEDPNTAAGFQTNYGSASEVTAPQLEVEARPYGFREAALRPLPDGRTYAKIREFVAPYYAFLPGNPETLSRRILCASVPLDNVTCAQWFMYYNLDRPPSTEEVRDRWAFATGSPDNFYEDPGSETDNWRQDREAMREGHFSGFPARHIFHEDFIVQESMGPIVDRTREHLNPSDRIVEYVRRRLLQSARRAAKGEPAWGVAEAATVDYGSIRSGALFLQPGEDWREVDFLALESMQAG